MGLCVYSVFCLLSLVAYKIKLSPHLKINFSSLYPSCERKEDLNMFSILLSMTSETYLLTQTDFLT